MTCHEVRERLSDLVDEALVPEASALVGEHLAGCPECRAELARVRATVALLRRVEPARAPAGFVDRVIRRARPVPWYRRVGGWLFVPLAIKLPAGAVAVALVTVMAVYLLERTPELRDAARLEPSAPPRVESPAPVQSPAPRGDEPSSRGPAPASGPQTPSASQTPQRAPTTPTDMTVESRREGASRELPVSREETFAATEAPTVRTAPEPPAPPPPSATSRLPTGRSAGATGERAGSGADPAAARPASAPRVAAMRAATPPSVVGRLDVADRPTALVSLAGLLSGLGGTETARRQDPAATVVEVVVPEPRYDELVRGLEALGSWSAVGQPTPSPPPPGQVRLTIHVR